MKEENQMNSLVQHDQTKKELNLSLNQELNSPNPSEYLGMGGKVWGHTAEEYHGKPYRVIYSRVATPEDLKQLSGKLPAATLPHVMPADWQERKATQDAALLEWEKSGAKAAWEKEIADRTLTIGEKIEINRAWPCYESPMLWLYKNDAWVVSWQGAQQLPIDCLTVRFSYLDWDDCRIDGKKIYPIRLGLRFLEEQKASGRWKAIEVYPEAVRSNPISEFDFICLLNTQGELSPAGDTLPVDLKSKTVERMRKSALAPILDSMERYGIQSVEQAEESQKQRKGRPVKFRTKRTQRKAKAERQARYRANKIAKNTPKVTAEPAVTN